MDARIIFSVVSLIGLMMLLPSSLLANADSGMIGNSMMNQTSTKSDVTMKMGGTEPPLKQFQNGIPSHNVKCKSGLFLVLKSSDNSPACVRPLTANALVARGWALQDSSMMSSGTMNHKMSQNMTSDTVKSKTTMNETKMANPASNAVDENQFMTAPQLVGISDYINTTPAKLAQDMKGKIVVYDFWTFNCINCVHTLSHMVDLNTKYLGKNVLVIGVHSPETIFEKDPNNVRDAVHRYNIQYPVVIDNEFQTWNAFGNHYWPHVYIADAQGKIRYDHIGEGAYDEIDKTVQSLLMEQEKGKPKDLAMA